MPFPDQPGGSTGLAGLVAEDDQLRLGIEDLEQRRRRSPEPVDRVIEPSGRVADLAGRPAVAASARAISPPRDCACSRKLRDTVASISTGPATSSIIM